LFLDMSLVITFIVHGQTQGKHKLLQKIITSFGDKLKVIIKETTRTLNAVVLTSEVIAKGTDYLIAVGGDGTVNEIVNAYLKSGTNKEIPIGIIPVGRGNDFVKSIGINKDLNNLFQAIENNRTKSVDVGWITFLGEDPLIDLNQKPIGRYFVNIADIGIGGLATQMVRTSPKFLWPNLTYALAIIKSLAIYRAQKVKITDSEWTYEGSVMSVCMANGKYFGSGLCIAPEAEISDGVAEIVIIGNVGIWDYLKKVSLLKKGRKINHPEIFYKESTSCTIESNIPMPIDIDGEFVGYTPLKMEMIQNRIKILV
jgi:diacylglycerol kinase (ATP)